MRWKKPESGPRKRGRILYRALQIVTFIHQQESWFCTMDLLKGVDFPGNLANKSRQAHRWMEVVKEILPLEVQYHTSKIEGRGTSNYYRLLRKDNR